MIVGGMVVFAVGTVAKYALRAWENRAVEPSGAEERGNSSAAEGGDGEGERQRGVVREEKRKARVSASAGGGLDLGTVSSRLALRRRTERDRQRRGEVLISSAGRRQTSLAFCVGDTEETGGGGGGGGGGGLLAGEVARRQLWSKPKRAAALAHLGAGLAKDTYRQLLQALPPPLSARCAPPQEGEGEGEGGEVIVDVGGVSIAGSDAYQLAARSLFDACAPAVDRLRSPCVVAVPSSLPSSHWRAARRAAERAGVRGEVTSAPDAVCAVWAAVERGLLREGVRGGVREVLVVDVGGMYTQLSLVSLSPSGGEEEEGEGGVEGGLSSLSAVSLVSSDMVSGVSGELFTHLLVEELSREGGEKGAVDVMGDPMGRQRLQEAAEAAKTELSNKPSTHVHIPFISATAKGPIDLSLALSRSRFEVLISCSTDQLGPAISRLLERTKTEGEREGERERELCYLLVGGGARIPSVQAQVRKAAAVRGGGVRGGGVEVVCFDEPEEAVALGAAYMAMLPGKE